MPTGDSGGGPAGVLSFSVRPSVCLRLRLSPLSLSLSSSVAFVVDLLLNYILATHMEFYLLQCLVISSNS